MVLFSKVSRAALSFLLMIPSARTGEEASFLGSKLPAAVDVPPRCPTFGEGGAEFFQASTYAEFVRCHNERYFAAYQRPRPIHVLFEAIGKTEFGAAFGLMKALAAEPEKYEVTYLSPGGTLVRRTPSTESRPFPHGLVILGPEERPGEDDTVVFTFAFPPEKNEDLRKAGINVLVKSMLSVFPDEYLVKMRQEGMKYSEIPDDDGAADISSEGIWIQTLRSQNPNPVDFVVGDCFGEPRSVKLLMARAQVPGASWSGNFNNVVQGLRTLANEGGVWEMVETQLRRAEVDPRFRDAELTPVFSAHFLGWGAEEEQPGLEAPEHAGAVGPTREVSFKTMAYTGPLVDYRMKVPISLVSDLPTAGAAVVHQRGADQELPEIKAIHAKMDELRAIRLIYIAFGSQGFRFKKGATKQIIDAAAAVPDVVVFFVVPPAADWVDSPPYPYETDSWQTNYYSATVAGDALTLPDNVLLSTWAPQKAIFERFGGPNTVFLTHGGAGSLSQGIANNVALACFGLAFDQPGNCVSVTEKGLGVDLRQFAEKMLFEDKTIEPAGGEDLVRLWPWLTPDREALNGDATPDAGTTIQARIEHIFEHPEKFPAALAKASDGLKAGAYAQDAVIGAFEKTMEEQLRLYKEMGLFQFDAQRGRGAVEEEQGGFSKEQGEDRNKRVGAGEEEQREEEHGETKSARSIDAMVLKGRL